MLSSEASPRSLLLPASSVPQGSGLTLRPSLIPRSPPGLGTSSSLLSLPTDDSSWHLLPASQRCWGEPPLPTTAALPWCFLSASLTQLLHSCFLGEQPLKKLPAPKFLSLGLHFHGSPKPRHTVRCASSLWTFFCSHLANLLIICPFTKRCCC